MWLYGSKAGLYFRTIRDNERAALAIGVPSLRYKMLSMAISAFMTALAGVFYAQFLLYVEPKTFAGLTIVIEIILFTVVGGTGTVWGPVLGPLLLVPLGEVLRAEPRRDGARAPPLRLRIAAHRGDPLHARRSHGRAVPARLAPRPAVAGEGGLMPHDARDRLSRLVDAQSVAIVGASDNPLKIGGRPIAYMKRLGYRGALYPVNPRQAEIQGLRAYPSLSAIGRPVDMAIVATGADLVEQVVREGWRPESAASSF